MSSSNTRRAIVLSAGDCPNTSALIRSQSSSSEVSIPTIKKFIKATRSKHIIMTTETNITGAKLTESTDSANSIETIVNNNNESVVESNGDVEPPATIAFEDQTVRTLRRSNSDSGNKQPAVADDNDSSSEKSSTDSSSQKILAMAVKDCEQSSNNINNNNNNSSVPPAQQKPPTVLSTTPHHPAVAFDPSTNEFTYLITVPRQLVDIHNVGSVVRTTAEAARIKHLMQFVADRYAPLPPAALTPSSESPTAPIPLLFATINNAITNSVTVEIALSEAALIDKSIYGAYSRRTNQGAMQQQMGNNGLGRL